MIVLWHANGEQAVVATDGSMAVMGVRAPLNFVRVKKKFARVRNQDPRKARKNALQASLVATLIPESISIKVNRG